MEELRKQLNASENAVLTLLVGGATNKQIAHALGFEPGTVKNYVSSVLRKSRKQTRLKLVVAYYKWLLLTGN